MHQPNQNINTPVDNFNYWKNVLNEKHNNREIVTSDLYESYAVAELAMQDYFLNKNTIIEEGNISFKFMQIVRE